MLKHGISESSVELSYLKAEKLTPALHSGSIDAFSMREPFISQAGKLLKDNFLVMEVPGLYLKSFNLICKSSFASEHPETLERLVQAYLLAENFLKTRQIESVVSLKNILGTDPLKIEGTLKNLDLRVNLSQSLLMTLMNQGRWAVQNELVEVSRFPNFFALLYPRHLKKLRPERVTLIQ